MQITMRNGFPTGVRRHKDDRYWNMDEPTRKARTAARAYTLLKRKVPLSDWFANVQHQNQKPA